MKIKFPSTKKIKRKTFSFCEILFTLEKNRHTINAIDVTATTVQLKLIPLRENFILGCCSFGASRARVRVGVDIVASFVSKTSRRERKATIYECFTSCACVGEHERRENNGETLNARPGFTLPLSESLSSP